MTPAEEKRFREELKNSKFTDLLKKLSIILELVNKTRAEIAKSKVTRYKKYTQQRSVPFGKLSDVFKGG